MIHAATEQPVPPGDPPDEAAYPIPGMVEALPACREVAARHRSTGWCSEVEPSLTVTHAKQDEFDYWQVTKACKLVYPRFGAPNRVRSTCNSVSGWYDGQQIVVCRVAA